MSYILDALRKADSERERGEVPGLHAHPTAPVVADTSGSHVNQKLMLAVGILTALLLLVLVWLIWGRGSSQPERPPMPPDQPVLGAAPTGAPTPPPGQWNAQNGSMPPPPQPGRVDVAPGVGQTAKTEPTPAPQVMGTPTPGLYPPALTPQPTTEAAASTTPKTVLPGMNAESAANTAPRKAAAAATSKQTEDTKVYRLMDLPESVRRDLPTLTIGGAMYSDTPANRMLIINSQVLHEGDKITADLTLEEIKLKSAVFRFRNYRYLVSY